MGLKEHDKNVFHEDTIFMCQSRNGRRQTGRQLLIYLVFSYVKEAFLQLYVRARTGELHPSVVQHWEFMAPAVPLVLNENGCEPGAGHTAGGTHALRICPEVDEAVSK